MQKPITVFWAPSRFTSNSEQWNMAYSEPKPVADNLVADITEKSLMVRCPATRNVLRNIYSLHSNLDESIDLRDLDLPALSQDSTMGDYVLPVESNLAIRRERPSSFRGYVNISYNLGWIFFADEPLVAKWSAPYFPTVTPTPRAIFTLGEYDIGQWFRSTNLDYHIPVESVSFNIKTGDPLAFLELKTERAVEFKRFVYTTELAQLSQEFSNSPTNYGKRLTLAQRYAMAKRAGMREIVLAQIQKNLV